MKLKSLPVVRVLLLVGLFLGLMACSQSAVKPVLVEETQKRIVVLPVFSLVKEFRQYSDDVHQRLLGQLKSMGYDPIVLEHAHYQQIRRQALEQSGSIYNPMVGEFVPYKEDVYLASLVEQLGSEEGFDLILLPELVLRDAKLDGDLMVWDGAKLPFQVSGDKKQRYKTPSRIRGLSLEIEVYTPGLRQKVRHFGAIAVPYYYDLNTTPPRFKLRENLFDGKVVDAGIGLAIDPLVNKQQKLTR
jgi:hypothetical protein